MNRTPVIKKGPVTISEAGLPENEWKKIQETANATINSKPPTISHLQATIKTAIKIKTGMLCIRKPRSFLLNGSFPSKTSNENIIIKSIARIVKIRGTQYKIFSLIIFLLVVNLIVYLLNVIFDF
jgi:hypothetical protein